MLLVPTQSAVSSVQNLAVLAHWALHVELLCILWLALAGTVRAFESRSPTHLGHGLKSDHMPAAHHHRRVFVGRLLLGYWADEDRVEMIGGW